MNDVLQQRYGKRNPSRKGIIALASTLTLVFLVWAGWATITGVQPTFKTTSYEVVGSNQVKVGISLDKPSDKNVACAIQALKVDFGIVGYKEVKYPQGQSHIQQIITFTTTEPAVTGLVDHCWFY